MPIALAGAGAVAVALVVLGLTGQLVALDAFDAGAAVRFGLPIARAAHDLAAALTVGLLFAGAFLIPPTRGRDARELGGVRRTAARLGATAGLVWLITALVVLVLTAAQVSGVPVGSANYGPVLISFFTQIDLGRALGVSALLIATATVIAHSATRIATLAWSAVLALVALLPLALAGHAASAADHMNSVDSLAVHLVSACLWVGGLGAILLLAGRLIRQDVLAPVVARYSTLALWCFLLVAASGILNAWLRLGSLTELASQYGILVIGKTVALVALGVAGLIHRRITIAGLRERPRLFLRLAAVELVVMGATMGLAVALARSATPAAQVIIDPVTALLGFPVPAPRTTAAYFGAFYADVLWLGVAAAGIGLYLAGVVRLKRRGDRWPIRRTVPWLAGCLVLVYVTSGGPGVYARLSFSDHMIQHMVLMLGVPLLWVLGAPITLAMRALRARTDGSFGPRELLLRLVHARFLAFLGHPIVAAALFTGGLVVFYYTGLFELGLATHTGHVLMTAHFLGAGYLFVWSLVGIDPGPQRPGYPFRVIILLASLGFHAFFGISMMSTTTVLAADWWHALGMRDDAALLADQLRGGSIAWAAGDLPSLLLGLALIVSWVTDDSRKARQHDRQADRDGDAELRRHNERLAELARMDRGR